MSFILKSFIFIFLLCVPLFLNLSTDEIIYADIYSIMVFLFAIYFLYNTSKTVILINSYIVFSVVSALVISIFVDNGTYLFEIEEYSYPIGVTNKIAIQCFIFFIGVTLPAKIVTGYIPKIYNIRNIHFEIIAFFVRLIVMIFILMLVYIGMKYGTPKELELHRGDFWATIAPSWGKWILDNIIQLVFLLSFLYIQRHKKLDIILSLLILIIIVWLGERATGILAFIFYFFTPIIVSHIDKIKFLTFKRLFYIFAIFLGVIAIFFASYSSSDSIEEIENKTTKRVAAQAQMWWALDRISSVYPKNNVFFDKYLGIFQDKRNSGTYYLMDQVAKKSIVDERYETNSTFTLSGFANNSYLFGYFIGGGLNFIWGLVVGLASILLRISVLSNNIFSVLITFKFYLKFQVMVLGGNIINLLTLNTFMFFIISILFLRFCLFTERNYYD